MQYAKDMPYVPSSGWGRCEDPGCPGKKSRTRAFGYLARHENATRRAIMEEVNLVGRRYDFENEDGRWRRNGRKRVVLPSE